MRPSGDIEAQLRACAPWRPPAYSIEDASAIRACFGGTALPHQQIRVIEFIIRAGRNDGATYFPGEGGRRDTDFALGRRFLSDLLVTIIKQKTTIGGENG